LLPAADASLIGVAIGLVMAGRTAVVELSGAQALWGAMAQIGQEAASLTGEFQGTLVIRVPIGLENNDALPMLEGIDHLTVASPANPADAGALMTAALSHRGVTLLLEPISVLNQSGGSAAQPRLGHAQVIEAGDQITIAAWGGGVAAAIKAARTLSTEGISAEVVDLRTLMPLDTKTLSASVHKTGRLILVEGGAKMLRVATESCFLRLESPPYLAEPKAIVSKARLAIQY
jgi:pyruvate/2-oxoglutarate/acetoin dehydrogenase E1 component